MKDYLKEERDTLQDVVSRVENVPKFKHLVTKFKKRIRTLNEKELTEFYDSCLIDNDSEENYFSYGISTGFDSELWCIDIEKFTDGLKSWIESEESEDEDDRSYYLTSAKKLINDLNKYIGYDFYFEDEVKE